MIMDQTENLAVRLLVPPFKSRDDLLAPLQDTVGCHPGLSLSKYGASSLETKKAGLEKTPLLYAHSSELITVIIC